MIKLNKNLCETIDLALKSHSKDRLIKKHFDICLYQSKWGALYDALNDISYMDLSKALNAGYQPK